MITSNKFVGFFFLKETALVTVCPKNETEVIEAATKLGCDNDKYGNSRYLCLPKKEKTSLVELCFDGVMGIQEKGKRSYYVYVSKSLNKKIT